MKLRSVELSNFRSHSHSKIEFADGLTAIVGPTGAGKSSVFEGVLWCLYGSAALGALQVLQPEIVRQGQSEASVTVMFETVAGPYRVTRKVRITASGATTALSLAFKIVVPDRWQDHSLSTNAETEAEIAKIVGPLDVALASWMARQNDLQALVTAQPHERRAVLGKALGLTAEWDRLHEKAKVQVASGEREVVRLTARVDALREQASHSLETAAVLTEAQDALAQAQRHLKTSALLHASGLLQAEHLRLTGYEDDYNAALKEHEAVEARRPKIEEASRERMAKLSDYAREQAIYKNETMPKYRDALKARAERIHRSRTLADEMQRLLNAPTECPTCHQPVSTAHLAPRIAEINLELQSLPETPVEPPMPEAPRAPLQDMDVDADIAALERAKKAMPDLMAKLRAVRDRKKVCTDALQEMGFTGSLPSDLAATITDLERLQKDLEKARGAVSDPAKAVSVLQERQRAEQEASKQAEAEKVALDAVQTTLDGWKLAAQALAPSGARQLVLDEALQRIHTEAASVLDALWPGTRLEVWTQTAKGGETVEVHVNTPTGTRRWQTFSGGEKTRLSFAFRLACASAAAAAHGLGALPMFAFDEAFGDQDSESKAAVVHCLTLLLGRVEQIIVVTHDEALLNRIDNVIRIEKVEGASRVCS